MCDLLCSYHYPLYQVLAIELCLMTREQSCSAARLPALELTSYSSRVAVCSSFHSGLFQGGYDLKLSI